MLRCFVRQSLILILAVLVTAGLSFSAVQAATVMPQTPKMSMTMAGMSDHGCKPCNDTAGGKAMVCSPICAAPLSASLETVQQPLLGQPARFAPLELGLTGRSQPPDPYPPRSFHIV
jgi:hypothetical protein